MAISGIVVKPGTLTEVRWHGRAGQGVVTASKLLAESALARGLYFQAFPEYGPEREGAPIQAFTRLATEPIRLHSGVTNPQIVVVFDSTLLKTVDVAEGLDEDGYLIVNSPSAPAEVRASLNLKSGKIFTVDATKIARETIGRPIPNTPILGALLRILSIMAIDEFLEQLKESMGKKFSTEIVEGNAQAAARAYEEVKGEG